MKIISISLLISGGAILSGCSQPGSSGAPVITTQAGTTNLCVVYIPYRQSGAGVSGEGSATLASPPGVKAGGHLNSSWGSVAYIGDCKDFNRTARPVAIPGAANETKPAASPASKPSATGTAKEVIDKTNAVTNSVLKALNNPKSKQRATALLTEAVPFYESVAQYEHLRPKGHNMSVDSALAALRKDAGISSPQTMMAAPAMESAASPDEILRKATQLQRQARQTASN